jgi:hypothetical protein
MALDALYFGAGHGQSLGQLMRVERRVDVVVEPVQRHTHVF